MLENKFLKILPSKNGVAIKKIILQIIEMLLLLGAPCATLQVEVSFAPRSALLIFNITNDFSFIPI